MNWLSIFDSWKSWPTSLVVGMVHGNELIGTHVLDKVRTILSKGTYRWKIMTLIWNPDAYRENKRFIDQDLNRSFGAYDTTNTEIRRAKEIKQFFETRNTPIDYVYDIHSTPTESEPMIICTDNPRSIDIARAIPIRYVILGLVDIIEGVSLTKHFSNQWAIDLAFECWSHVNPSSIVADQIIETILNVQNGTTSTKIFPQDRIQISETIVTSDKDFQFSRNFQGFERLEKWEVLATEWDRIRCMDEDRIIIIPRPDAIKELDKKKEVIMWYLGKLL